MDQLCLVKAVNGFCQGIVVASPLLPTEGSMPASVSRSVSRMETYWDPRPAIRVMDQTGVPLGLAGLERLL
ncbi:hypothetical protein A9J41_14840 [Laribacter hongkongensis]|nr:hypothetical protein [Laribacter hongkongensis]